MTYFHLSPEEVQFIVAFRLLPASQQEAISTTVQELSRLLPQDSLPENVVRLHA